MPKLARMGATPARRTPIRTTGATLPTYGYALGYEREPKGELYLLAASNLVGEQSFYEAAPARDARYRALIAQCTAEDPAWVAGLAAYLRGTLYMRSAAVVLAAEYVAAGGPNGRSVVASVLQRADEPGELLGYWHGAYGRQLPAAIKRGTADAVGRLYNERSVLKYDGKAQPYRFGDVLELVHPRPADAYRSTLYKHLLDRRHGARAPRALGRLWIDQRMQETPLQLRGLPIPPDMPWERYAAWVGRPLTAPEWEAALPNMGLMAVTRNLRNMDEAGVGTAAWARTVARYADPADVAASKMLPFRFYTAWRNVGSTRWGPALEAGLECSTASVPTLGGRTLILVDESGSMQAAMSARGTVPYGELAAVFAAALAKRAVHPAVYAYDTHAYPVPVLDSVLRMVERTPRPGGGTRTHQVAAGLYGGEDRVIIITDEQAFTGTGLDTIPCPIYTFNVVGYRAGHQPSGTGNRYTFGGLSDGAFTMLGAIEAGRAGRWPWEAA